ncbi:translocation/assembly module TamB domain-containing protein [Thermodesulfobacteriota bacterium]
MKKIIKLMKWPALMAGTFILLFSLIFYFFQTDFGRERLLSILNRSLAEKSIRIKIKNSGGIIPFSFTADQLEVTDRDGVFLDARDIAFRLSTSSLLKGRLHIKGLSVDSMIFKALPRINKKEISDQQKASLIPEIFFRMGITRLMINHLQIPESLFGESMDFQVMISVSGDSKLNQSHVNMNVDRIDETGSSMFFNAIVRGTQPYLTMSAGVDDQNGFITGLLGSKGKTLLSLTGEGPLTDWSGALKAKVENIASLESEIGLELNNDPKLKLAGDIEFSKGFIPENAEKNIGQHAGFLIETRLKEKRNLEFERLEFKTESAQISLRGFLGLKDLATKGNFDILINDLSLAEQLINRKSTGNVRMKGEFTGPLFEPRVSSDINIRDLKVDTVKTDNLALKLNLAITRNPDNNSPLFHITGNGIFNNVAIKYGSVDLSEEKITLNLDVMGPAQDNIVFKKLDISGRDTSLSASGRFNQSLKTISAGALIDIKSIYNYSSLSGLDIKGNNSLEIKLFADLSASTFSTVFKGKLNILPEANNSYEKFVGQILQYSGQLKSADFHSIHFSDIDVRSDRGSLTGSGIYDFSARVIDTNLTIKIPRLDELSSALGYNLKGSGQLYAEITGTMDRIDLKTKTLFQNLSVNNRGVDSLTAVINTSGKPMNNEGNLSITLDKSDYSIKGTSFFKLQNNILNFKKLEINGSGIRVEGDFNTRIDKPLLDGHLRLICDDLTGPSSFLDENISGSLSMEGVFHKGGKDIDIDLNISGSDLVSRFVKTENLDLKARITGPLDSPLIKSHMFLKNVKQDNLIFESINAKVNGSMNNADFELKGTGRSGHEFQVDFGGTYLSDKAKQILHVKHFQAKYGALPLNLINPFNLTRSADTIELEDIELNFDRGIIRSSGNLTENKIRFSLEYRDIPLNSFSLIGISEVKGLSSGKLSVGGSLSEPVVTSNIDVDFIWILSEQYDEPLTIKATLNTFFDSGKLHVDISVNGTKPGTFTGSIDAPFQLSISPFSYSFAKTGEMSGALAGQIEMSNISPLMDLVGHRVNGRINVDFNMGGTVLSPKITGQAYLKDGGYENLKTGTILREIEMEISAEPPRLNITKITAIDGLGGTVTGRGWIDAIPDMKFPYKLEFDLNDFTLAQNDMISITAEGRPFLSGSLSGHKLYGNLGINKAELNIPDNLSPEITELEVKEINVDKKIIVNERKITKAKKSELLKLDLYVNSPGKVYVNGRGLNSEWSGNLDIKGSADSPIMTGKLSIVRGYYNFLGKRLQITQGDIFFDGKIPLSPRINITGETISKDIKVYVKIAGDIKSPEFKLESEPYLPSDEIFSRLLFGRSAAQITPIQAIQLANAVNTFIKGGKGFNILDRTRKLLMVDQLEIKQSGENMGDSTISAGKYLRDNIYLEVEQGLGSESGSASIKWELSPSISLETEINAKDEAESGINWKKDY